MELDSVLEELGIELGEPLSGPTLDFHLHGEWLLQLEVLAERAYELDVGPSARALALASRAAVLMGNSAAARKAHATLEASGTRGTDGRYRVRIIFLGAVRTPLDLHVLLANALDLPTHYGHNWDAFWDLLTEIWPLPHTLELWDWPTISESAPEVAKVLLTLLLDYQRELDPSFNLVLRDRGHNELSTTTEFDSLAGG